MVKTLLLLSWLIFHPVHVTITSIDYFPGLDSYKVYLKMYYDDFLLDSKMKNIDSGRIDFPERDVLHIETVSNYLDEKFMIYVNKKQLSGEIEEMKLIDGELNVNLIFKSARNPRFLTIKNMIMTSLYSDQVNMMIVKVNDFEEGIKFTPEKTEQSFKIK